MKAKIIKIPKKSGGHRTIAVPRYDYKRELRMTLPKLHSLAAEVCDEKIVHGFMIGKSPVTNAMAHVGYKWSVCFDLADFFDTVTDDKVAPHCNRIPSACFYSMFQCKVAAQGLPTSPLVANIAAAPMDEAIQKAVAPRGIRYTRYADDLTFSGNNEEDIPFVLQEVPKIVEAHGFKVNPKKTHVQHSKAGRRIITGVAVDANGIHPTRAVKRKLRAAKHKKRAPQARGLEEWMKLKAPSGNPSGTKAQVAVAHSIAVQRLGLD